MTDTTGAYNAMTNPTGYGAPNPTATYPPFSSSVVNVYMPDSETLLPSTTAISVNLQPTFPSASNGTFSITNVLLGFSSTYEMPDGVYKFVWTQVYDDGGEQTVETTEYLVVYQTVECCINNLIIDSVGCSCHDAEEKQVNLAVINMYLDMMRPKLDAAGEVIPSVVDTCQYYDKAATMILAAQDVCDSENCSGGCGGC
jgi:hypothetical protein